jgi:N-acetylated-alpha-linked acidic dipeptidase
VILKIPVLPISYGDAQHFLAALGGRVVPPAWRGALPITYHVGGGSGDGARVHMAVKSDWPLKTIYNVVAVLREAPIPTSGSCAATTMTDGCSAPPTR